MPVRLLGLAAVLFAVESCAPAPPHEPRGTKVLVWHTIGSWSGRGSSQTGSFVSDTGTLRVRWQTRTDNRKETGTFRLTVQSAISGRAVAVAAEQRGSGQGDSSVALDPSPLYILIESKDLDWSFTVEEALDGVVGGRSGSASSEFRPAACPAVVEPSPGLRGQAPRIEFDMAELPGVACRA